MISENAKPCVSFPGGEQDRKPFKTLFVTTQSYSKTLCLSYEFRLPLTSGAVVDEVDQRASCRRAGPGEASANLRFLTVHTITPPGARKSH